MEQQGGHRALKADEMQACMGGGARQGATSGRQRAELLAGQQEHSKWGRAGTRLFPRSCGTDCELTLPALLTAPFGPSQGSDASPLGGRYQIYKEILCSEDGEVPAVLLRSGGAPGHGGALGRLS